MEDKIIPFPTEYKDDPTLAAGHTATDPGRAQRARRTVFSKVVKKDGQIVQWLGVVREDVVQPPVTQILRRGTKALRDPAAAAVAAAATQRRRPAVRLGELVRQPRRLRVVRPPEPAVRHDRHDPQHRERPDRAVPGRRPWPEGVHRPHHRPQPRRVRAARAPRHRRHPGPARRGDPVTALALTPATIPALLERHGLAPSRALGQNFLADPNTARRIVRLAGRRRRRPRARDRARHRLAHRRAARGRCARHRGRARPARGARAARHRRRRRDHARDRRRHDGRSRRGARRRRRRSVARGVEPAVQRRDADRDATARGRAARRVDARDGAARGGRAARGRARAPRPTARCR